MPANGASLATPRNLKRKPSPADEVPIIRVRRNAWRTAKADRLAVLVDGKEYFRRLEQVLPKARRSIWIVGWDFHPEILLSPDRDPSGEKLGPMLRRLVEENEALEVRILVWSMGPIYSSKSLKLYSDHQWADHPRIHLRFDTKHALRGSHHQKMVAIDDVLAFVGGIDLTAGRWDTSEHAFHSPLRTMPSGDPYPPVHDVQAAVSGAAARAVGDLIRERWRRATGEKLRAIAEARPIWPAGLKPEMEGCEIAIARSEPKLLGRIGRRETIRLTHDALKAARRHIYCETQYLASFAVGRTLARRLGEPDGPEIVIVVTSSSRGLVEQFVMGHNRDRLLRRLKQADKHDRLRVMYAVVPDDAEEREVLVHAKVLIVDDRFVRVGSSNLNNRSEGLDTECDIAVEASTDAERSAIVALRNRLLAEHLDATPALVAAAMEETGSLVETLERLNIKRRGLRPFPVDAARGRTAPLFGTGLFDPKEPFWPLQKVRDRIGSAAAKLMGVFF